MQVLGPNDLDEETEQRLVASNLGRGLLLPYRDFDASAAPLVLVHGMKCSASLLSGLLEGLAERTYRQPYIFVYDDLNRYIDRCGDDLARAIGDLGHRDVQIIAHSMGGIVARCALNSMVNPRWFPEFHGTMPDGQPARVRGTEPEAVAGIRLERPIANQFSRMDLLTIDTPWHGFADPPIQVRTMLEQQASYVDMVSNSAVMMNVSSVRLPPHFSVNHVEADNRGAGLELDKVIGLGELTDDDLQAVVRYFAGDASALEGKARLRNQLRALESEEDFPRLRERLLAEKDLSAARFVMLAASAVKRVTGSHNSVLDNPALLDEIEDTFAKSRRAWLGPDA